MNRREALKSTALIFGYALTGSTVAAIMQSCDSGSKLAWSPQVLSEAQANTLSAVVDRILPTTATPGALDIGVDEFIDKILFKVFPENIQRGFAAGLEEFNTKAKSEYGTDFIKLKDKQKDELIRLYEEKSGPLPGSMWGFSFGESAEFPFYRMMKELSLLGYFQSEKISKEVLSYDPIPGPYMGCIPYHEVGKVWSE